MHKDNFTFLHFAPFAEFTFKAYSKDEQQEFTDTFARK
jgi:hypothetical protein